MADSATPVTKTTDDPTVELENDNLTPVENPESGEALDALLAKAQSDEGDGEGDGAQSKPTGETGVDHPIDPKPTETPTPGEVKVKEGAALAPVPDPAAAPAATPTDDLDTVELPPHTKPKTAESFAKVKFMARERITALQKERDELKAKHEQAEARAKEVTPEIKKELEELRAFRQKVDVEADPVFREWDDKVKSNDDMIYSRLKSSGFSEETLKKIQELGGPANVDWDAIGDKLPAGLKRYIEGKVFENEDLAERKKQAIEKAKANAAEYLKGRQGELAKGTEQRVKESTAEFEKAKPQLKWLVKKDTATAKPEEKAFLEAHNKLVEEVEQEVQDAIADDSPGMKALLVSAYCQARRSKFEYDILKSSTTAEIEKLKKELEEKSGLLERIKKSGTPRLASSAPAGKPSSAPKAGTEYLEHGSDALDRHLKETLAAEKE